MDSSITLVHSKSASAVWLCAAIALISVQASCVTEQPQAQPQADPPPTYTSSPPAPSSSQELDQLVAPIALYPDALVAQILAAATYPTEVVEADRWMQENSSLKGDALAKAVDGQSWDPSVKALAQFPTVLEMMDKNLSWTSSLGEAYGNDRASVLDAVQEMRARAQQAGNLKSTTQQTVTTQGQTIVIEPANPDVVYLPEYDPWLVYGPDLAIYPGWFGVPGLFYDGPGLFFDVGIGIGVFAGFGWGWGHWGADWHDHYVDHDHHHFVSHSPTFGHSRSIGGAGAFGRPAGFHPGGSRSGGFDHLSASPGAVHSSAFSGFNHGGITGARAMRGAASFGHSAFGGGFHGGGFHGGGGHR